MRIRSIKPEFWRSEDIAALPIPDRLLFIGLWSYVDDNGVGPDRESLIAADLFADDLSRDPRDTLARISEGLRRLSDSGLITRYTVENRRYIAVTTWGQHQRIDKPNKPRYPLPTSENAEFATPSRDSREIPAPGTGEQGNRGTGEQVENTLPEPPVPASDATGQTKPKRASYPPAFNAWWSAYPKHKNGSKKSAYAEWQRATKIIDATALHRLTEAYAANPGVSSVDYCPDAHRWLKDRRWETVTETDHRVTASRQQPQPRETIADWGASPEAADYFGLPWGDAPTDTATYVDAEIVDITDRSIAS